MITSGLGAQRRLVALGVTATALVVSTGGGSAASATTNTTPGTTTPTITSTQPSTTGTTPATNPAADTGIARNAELKLRDFPSGWERRGDPPADLNSSCTGFQMASMAASAAQSSAVFAERADTEYQVRSFVFGFPDAQVARQALSLLISRANRACVAEIEKKDLAEYYAGLTTGNGPKLTVGRVTTRLVSMPPVGDQHADARLTVSLHAPGEAISVYLDYVFARTGRGVAGLAVTGAVLPLGQSVTDRLIKTVVDRLEPGFG